MKASTGISVRARQEDVGLCRRRHARRLAALAECDGWVSWLDYIAKRVSAIDDVTTPVTEPGGLSNRTPSLQIKSDLTRLGISGTAVAKLLLDNVTWAKPLPFCPARQSQTSGSSSTRGPGRGWHRTPRLPHAFGACSSAPPSAARRSVRSAHHPPAGRWS